MKRSRKEEEDEYSLLWGEMSWCRGPMIGQGAFGSVYRAELKKPRAFGSVVAVKSVKSADPINLKSLMWENTVLDALQGCPHVIQTFGSDTTETTNGIVLYNILLEFASGGSLADLIVESGFHGLSEGVVRKHTKSLLVGLKHIHARGFVHCDLKPDNVLFVATADGFEVKIADFGLAKRAYTSCETPSWRGTSWYIAPECVIYGVQEAFSDIWALGCTVLVMLTGKVPWTTITGSKEYESLMSQIGSGSVPDIPDQISKAAQDFLRCCFELNPMERMTVEALLDHPFLVGLDEIDSSSHLQLSKEEGANGKRIKRSPSYFPFGSSFIHFPFGRSFIPLSEVEVPEIQAENTKAVTSFPFGCSFIPLPDSSSEEGEKEVIQEPADSFAEQINFSAIFPKPLILRSRPLACWQHPFTFTTCAGA